MYKKSYKGFVLSLLIYLVLIFTVSFIPAADESQPIRLVMLLTAWYMAGLTFYIWRTERIYLYNGTTYEEADAAGRERRKAFAWRHFRIFGMFALLMTVLSCGMQLLGWPVWSDFTLGTVGLCAACFMTIPIKL